MLYPGVYPRVRSWSVKASCSVRRCELSSCLVHLLLFHLDQTQLLPGQQSKGHAYVFVCVCLFIYGCVFQTCVFQICLFLFVHNQSSFHYCHIFAPEVEHCVTACFYHLVVIKTTVVLCPSLFTAITVFFSDVVVYPAIVLAAQGLFLHNIHADCRNP